MWIEIYEYELERMKKIKLKNLLVKFPCDVAHTIALHMAEHLKCIEGKISGLSTIAEMFG